MGANLMVSYVHRRIGSEEIRFDRAKEKVMSLLKIHMSEWENTIPGYQELSEQFNIPLFVEGSSDDAADRHKTCDLLIKCIEEVEMGWNGELRDMVCLEIGGLEILMSAVMSYGDLSESCRAIDLFIMAGLHLEAGFE